MSFVQKYIKSNGSYEPKICGQVKIAGRLKSRTSSDFKNILKKIVGNMNQVITMSREQINILNVFFVANKIYIQFPILFLIGPNIKPKGFFMRTFIKIVFRTISFYLCFILSLYSLYMKMDMDRRCLEKLM